LLQGIKSPRSKRKRERVELAAGLLAEARDVSPRQDEESIAGTFERLQVLHQELAPRRGEAAALAATPRPRLKKMLLATSLAAAAVLVGLTLFLVLVWGPGLEPVGTVYAERGQVDVVDPEGNVITGEDRLEVYEGYTLKTGEDSRAAIAFNDGSQVRLDSFGSLEIDKAADGELHVLNPGGNCYHRIAGGTRYRLICGGFDIMGDSCAFNTDWNTGGNSDFRIVAIYGSVTVEGGGASVRVNEGQMAMLSRPFLIASLKPVEAKPEDVDTLWFAWNEELDKLSGFEPGILAGVEEELLEEPPPPEAPAAQPAEPPPPPVTPQPEQPQGSASLSVDVGTAQNILNWSIVNGPASRRVIVLRSDSNAQPSYPPDTYSEVDPASTSFTDANTTGGVTYYYRLAVLSGETVAFYSNVVEAAVTPWGEVSLSTSLDGGTVVLNWTSGANFTATSYAVCRSGNGTEPVFPPSTGQEAWLVVFQGPAGTYRDSAVQPGRTYRYRVALLSGSTPVAYSNAVSVTVTAVPAQ